MSEPPSGPDVVLSSGFLAFASHLGFLKGLEACAVKPGALVGTSSGALVGALYAAGKHPDEIAEILQSRRPISFLRPRLWFWQGVFQGERLLKWLEQQLPASFDELRIPFAVGVTGVPSMQHRLVHSGELPRAVLASCAVPKLLAPVHLEGRAYVDGGAADRLALAAWRSWRPGATAIVHRVERSMGPEGSHDLANTLQVTSPRSHNSLLRLTKFQSEMEAAQGRTQEALAGKRSFIEGVARRFR